MDGARRFRRHMARYAVRPREWAEQLAHARHAAVDTWIDLGVGTFEVRMRDEAGAAMAGADHVDHVEIALDDRAVQVRVDEIEARGGAPMAEQAVLDVFLAQRLAEHRVVAQVDLPDGEVIGGTPVGMHAAQQIRRERLGHGEAFQATGSPSSLCAQGWSRREKTRRRLRPHSAEPTSRVLRSITFMASSAWWCASRDDEPLSRNRARSASSRETGASTGALAGGGSEVGAATTGAAGCGSAVGVVAAGVAGCVALVLSSDGGVTVPW